MSGRDVARAIRLADGAYLIRTGCCRPASCAPAAGIRCCLGARCACDWPDSLNVSARWVNPPHVTERRWPAVRNVIVLVSILGASAALVIGAVIVVAAHIVAVLVAAGASLLTLAGVAWLRRGKGGPKYIVNIRNS